MCICVNLAIFDSDSDLCRVFFCLPSLCVCVCVWCRYAVAQPALIYLLPMTLGPTVIVALARGDLSDLWHGTSLTHAVESADTTDLHVV